MYRLSILILVAAGSVSASAQETVSLNSVGLSVDIGREWKLATDETTNHGEAVSGLVYVLHVDSTTADLFTIQRVDNFDTSDKRVWARDENFRPSADFEVVEINVDLPNSFPFDDAVASIRRQNRGDEYGENGRSLYYVIRAVRGRYTFNISLGGLEKSFEDKRPEYFAMLSSLRVVDAD